MGVYIFLKGIMKKIWGSLQEGQNMAGFEVSSYILLGPKNKDIFNLCKGREIL